MTLIEAMKELKVIEKKMARNTDEISKYAAQQEIQKPIFETEKAQREEVEKRVQANEDLAFRYMDLKERIEKTNVATKLPFGSRMLSISALLVLRRKLGSAIVGTYRAMDDSHIRGVLRGHGISSGPEVKIVRFYDEKMKMEKLGEWHDLLEAIDGRLEVANATTELLEVF